MPVYSNDQDIYDAAATAGYIPQSSPSESLAAATEPGPVTSPSELGVKETTDDFIRRLSGGNVEPDNLPATKAQRQAEAQAAGIQPVQGGSTSTGASASGRGFNEGKYKQVSGTEGDLRRDMAAADQAGQEELNRDTSLLSQGAQNQRRATAAVGTAEGNVELAKGMQAHLLNQINAGFAQEEAKINEHYRSEANQVKADYMTALADFRASKVDPDQLWKRGGVGGQMATMAAVFVHDFLGAKGIQTSAMDTLNRAIDRNIAAQEAEMRKKGQVAEGFKSLWDMQRAQSASDAEARMRVRGFMLESAKQAVISNMAPYQSALATAQGQAAVAKIDEEYAKNLIDVYGHIDTVTNARKAQAIQIWAEKLKNAQESWANSIKQQEVNQKGKIPSPLQDLVISPLTKKPIGVYRPGITDTEKEKFREKLGGLGEVQNMISEMQELIRRNPGRNDFFVNTRFADTDGQRFDFLRNQVAQTIEYATQHRGSSELVKQDLNRILPDTVLNRGDAEKVLAQVE